MTDTLVNERGNDSDRGKYTFSLQQYSLDHIDDKSTEMINFINFTLYTSLQDPPDLNGPRIVLHIILF